MEQQVIKLLLNRENYDNYHQYIEERHFPSSYNKVKKIMWDIYCRLVDYHKNNTSDITIEDLRALHLGAMQGVATDRLMEYEEAYKLIEKESITEASEELIKALRITGLSIEAQDLIDDGKIDKATDLLEQITKLSEKDEGLVSDTFDLTELEGEMEANNIWKWNIPGLDDYLDGFGPERSVLFFARPNSGKTSTILANTVDFMRQGAKVMHFAISEDTTVALVRRYYQAAYNIPDSELNTNITHYANMFAEEFEGKFFLKNVATLSLKQVNEYTEGFKPDVVVYDQYQKVRVYHDQESRSDEVLTIITQKLKEVAKRNQHGIILATQASASGDNKKWLGLNDVAGSKTGVPGELQAMVGVGMVNGAGLTSRWDKEDVTHECLLRYFNICKNKGAMGKFEVGLQPDECLWV